jgi:hypothetical protein
VAGPCERSQASGYLPRDTIVMRHTGSEVNCLQSTIGEAARLRASEPDAGKQSPTFRGWRPHGTGGGLSRIESNDPGATREGQNAPPTAGLRVLIPGRIKSESTSCRQSFRDAGSRISAGGPPAACARGDSRTTRPTRSPFAVREHRRLVDLGHGLSDGPAN